MERPRDTVQCRVPEQTKLRAKIVLLKRKESMQDFLVRQLEQLANEEPHAPEEPRAASQAR